MIDIPARQSISVVVPCHNDGHYLPLLVKRLFEQSHKPEEVLVIDDASTDDTAGIIAALASKYPRVKIHHNPQNLGVIQSINKGVELATGQFIYMTGCDDFPLAGLFEKSVAMLDKHPKAPLCFSNPCNWEENSLIVNEHLPASFSGKSGYLTPAEAAVALSGMPFVHPHSGLIRRADLMKIGIYDPALEASADWFSWLTLIFRKGCCYIPEPLSLWRVRKNSYHASAFEDKKKKYAIIERAFEKVLSAEMDDIFSHFVVSNAFSIFGRSALEVYLGTSDKSGDRGRSLLQWTHGAANIWPNPATQLRIWKLDLASTRLFNPSADPNSRQAKEAPPTVISPRYVRVISSIAMTLGIHGPLRRLQWLFLDPLTRSLRSPADLVRQLIRIISNRFRISASVTAPPPRPQTLEELEKIGDGDLNVKIDALDQALLEYPNHPTIWGMLAAAHLRNAQYQLAIKNYERFEAAGICTPRIALERYVAHICIEEQKEAIRFLQGTLRKHPEITDARVLLGIELEHQGFLSEALEQFKLARSNQGPGLEVLHELTRILYNEHGQRERSITCWKRLFREINDSLFQSEIQVLDVPWTVAIGHFAILDAYLKASILGIVPYKKRVLLARDGIYPASKDSYITNHFILKLFKDVIEIADSPETIAKFTAMGASLRQPMTVLERTGGDLEFWPRIATETQARWEKEKRAPLITVPDAYQQICRSALATLGVPENTWFATLHVRDTYERAKDKSTHARNADIRTYELAVRSVISRGGFVIRLGDPRMPAVSFGNGFIDYAHSPMKSELLDVLLLSQAHFHIGTDSGLSILPGIFGVPCAYTNWAPPGTFSWYGRCLYILKSLRNSKGEHVKFSEMVRSPLGSCESMYYLKSNGYTLHDNSAEEIEELVTEMMDWLDGNRQLDPDDIANQTKLDLLVAEQSGYGRCQLGRGYLRRHAYLLPAAT